MIIYRDYNYDPEEDFILNILPHVSPLHPTKTLYGNISGYAKGDDEIVGWEVIGE